MHMFLFVMEQKTNAREADPIENRLFKRIESVSNVIENSDRSAPRYIERGALYLLVRMKENAASDFEKANEIDPKFYKQVERAVKTGSLSILSFL